MRSLAHRSTRRLAVLLVLVGCVSALIAPAPATTTGAADIAAYRGLGTWVDIYDTAQLDHPVATVKAMKRRGVRTLFLETGNYTRGPIYRPAAAARFIHAAHRRGMKVIAWYLPSFTDPDTDFERSMASVRFRTDRGHRFDGFGLDIEATNVEDISLRIKRMLSLSRRIRAAVGDAYSLGAIVPSPFGMSRMPGYWGNVRRFPWAELSRIYDAIVPMSYFAWRVDGMRRVYEYNAFNIRLIRQESGDPSVPVHLIGGIAGETSRSETRGFVRAIRTFGAPGGSYYAFDSTRREHWRELRQIPANPPQSPPLPIPLGQAGWSNAIGNVPGADRSHPKEVFFRVGPRSEPLVLSYETFDADSGELDLQVNWRSVSKVPAGPDNDWSESRAIRIPGWRFHDDRSNLISFVARGAFPDWTTWGVRNVIPDATP